MGEKGTCGACGRERVLRPIDSGQRLCTACYKEIKPPRPKHLAAWSMLESFHARGIALPEDTTKAQVEQLRADLACLGYLLMNVWYALVGRGFDYSGGDRDVLERLAWEVLRTGEFGQRMLQLERWRQAVGQQVYEQTLQANRLSSHSTEAGPGFYVEDGVLYDRATGRDLAFWHFKPPLPRDAAFDWLHDLLHAHSPAVVPPRRR